MANELVVKNGLIVSGSATILDNLVVTGDLTARQYIVSSSVTYLTESYASGSTNWGDTLDDYHNVTGSLNVTGSIYLNGSPVGTGKLDITDFTAYTGATRTELNAIETATGSLNSFTSSINTTIKNKMNSDGVISGSVQVDITQTTGYSTFSGSVATTTSGLSSDINSLSGSVATTTSGLSSDINNLSGSAATLIDTKVSNLSGSVATTTSNLSSDINSLSGSVATTTSGLSTDINNLSGSVTSYVNTKVNTLSGSVATTTSNLSSDINSLSDRKSVV